MVISNKHLKSEKLKEVKAHHFSPESAKLSLKEEQILLNNGIRNVVYDPFLTESQRSRIIRNYATAIKLIDKALVSQNLDEIEQIEDLLNKLKLKREKLRNVK